MGQQVQDAISWCTEWWGGSLRDSAFQVSMRFIRFRQLNMNIGSNMRSILLGFWMTAEMLECGVCRPVVWESHCPLKRETWNWVWIAQYQKPGCMGMNWDVALSGYKPARASFGWQWLSEAWAAEKLWTAEQYRCQHHCNCNCQLNGAFQWCGGGGVGMTFLYTVRDPWYFTLITWPPQHEHGHHGKQIGWKKSFIVHSTIIATGR